MADLEASGALGVPAVKQERGPLLGNGPHLETTYSRTNNTVTQAGRGRKGRYPTAAQIRAAARFLAPTIRWDEMLGEIVIVAPLRRSR
jgi:hypothetical protein